MWAPPEVALPALALLLLLAAEPSVPAAPSAPPVPPTAAANQVEAPVYATGGYAAPRVAEPGCVGRALVIPKMPGIPSDVTVKFAVRSSGAVDSFEPISEVATSLSDAIQRAVMSCRFIPGTDSSGQPADLWKIMPLRFEALGAKAITSLARESEPGCIARNFRLPVGIFMSGRLKVQVKVAPGAASGKVIPGRSLRGPVVESLQAAVDRCPMVPATDADGKPREDVAEVDLYLALPDDDVRAEQRPRLLAEPLLENRRCVFQQLSGLGRTRGVAYVMLEVSEVGAPSKIRIEPQGMPLKMRLELLDAVSSCPWLPARDLEGRPVKAAASLTVTYD